MSPSARRARTVARQILTCAAIGTAGGAIVGSLIVSIGWFPGAMAAYSENPNFLDPRQSLAVWCATWSMVCGMVGFVVGTIIGAFRAATNPPD